MTGYTLTQPEVWFSGPLAYQAAGTSTVGWVTTATASTSAQSLVQAASGASGAAGSDQPYFPAGFWQRPKQVSKFILHGVMTLPAVSTNITFSLGTSGSTPQGPTVAPTATTTLWTSPTYTNAVVQTAVPWHFDLDMICQKIGVGSTAVSTSLLTNGVGGWTPAVTPAVGAVPNYGPTGGTVYTQFDNSINQFIWAAVTFSVSSVSNTCTMTSMYVYGMN